MNNLIAFNIIRFFIVIAIQVLILNHLDLHGFINPYIYPIAILLMPFETPMWALLISAFIAGTTIDMFANTPGLHATVTLFTTYLRPQIIHLNRPLLGYESNDRPNIKKMGFKWFIIYAAALIAIHHLSYFFLEAYTLQNFFDTIFKAAASFAISLTIIILSQYLIYTDI